MSTAFKSADILLPRNADMSKWAVVACDQYTSEPEYWADVEKITEGAKSALTLSCLRSIWRTITLMKE